MWPRLGKEMQEAEIIFFFLLLCSLFQEISGKKEFAFLFKAAKVNLHFTKNCKFFLNA